MKRLLFSIIIFLTACNDSATLNSQSFQKNNTHNPKDDSTTFHAYKHDLFINTKGQLAYKTIDNSDPTKPEDKFLTTINSDALNNKVEETLNRVIDTASFIYIGDLYYKDKSHVYTISRWRMVDPSLLFGKLTLTALKFWTAPITEKTS